MAAAWAIAYMVPTYKLSAERIIPDALDKNVANIVADAVKKAYLAEKE